MEFHYTPGMTFTLTSGVKKEIFPEYALYVRMKYKKINKNGKSESKQFTEKFNQIVSPRNLNEKGEPKKEEEIKLELKEEADAWINMNKKIFPNAKFLYV